MRISKIILSNNITAHEICIDEKFYFVFYADGEVHLWENAFKDLELPVLNASLDIGLFWTINNIENDFEPGFICIIPQNLPDISKAKIFGALETYYKGKAKRKRVET